MAATRKLNIIIVIWALCIVLIAVCSHAQDLPIPQEAVDVLSHGTTQGVLAMVVMGLTVGFLWTARKLLAAKDEQIELSPKQASDVRDILDKRLEENTKALATNAQATKEVTKVIERCTKEHNL